MRVFIAVTLEDLLLLLTVMILLALLVNRWSWSWIIDFFYKMELDKQPRPFKNNNDVCLHCAFRSDLFDVTFLDVKNSIFHFVESIWYSSIKQHVEKQNIDRCDCYLLFLWCNLDRCCLVNTHQTHTWPSLLDVCFWHELIPLLWVEGFNCMHGVLPPRKLMNHRIQRFMFCHTCLIIIFLC